MLTLPIDFDRAMARFQPFEQHPVLAVGVSGGSDSMALLMLANRWARARGGAVVALTVDHGLREGSRQEALSVGAWLAERHIQHVILPWEGEKPSRNIQAAARKARYTLLTKWCRVHHILHLLVAHQAEDQAETVLLRLLRGSGVEGLAAMPESAALHGIRLLRPLLHCAKNPLQEALQEAGWPWVEDPSNSNERFERVKCRHWLASQKDPPLAVARLSETASHMGRAREALEKEAATAMAHYVAIYPEGYATLAPEALHALPEETGLRLLAAVLRTIGGEAYKTRFSHLKSLYAALCKAETFTGRTLQHCAVFPYRGNIIVAREGSAVPKNTPLLANVPLRWDGRFKLQVKGKENNALHVVPLSPAMWNQLCTENPGLKRNPKVKNLPKKVLYTLPAVTDLEKIIAVPHMYWVNQGENCEVFCRFNPRVPLAGAYFRYSAV